MAEKIVTSYTDNPRPVNEKYKDATLYWLDSANFSGVLPFDYRLGVFGVSSKKLVDPKGFFSDRPVGTYFWSLDLIRAELQHCCLQIKPKLYGRKIRILNNYEEITGELNSMSLRQVDPRRSGNCVVDKSGILIDPSAYDFHKISDSLAPDFPAESLSESVILPRIVFPYDAKILSFIALKYSTPDLTGVKIDGVVIDPQTGQLIKHAFEEVKIHPSWKIDRKSLLRSFSESIGFVYSAFFNWETIIDPT